nr:verprolin-like [Lolium perenne]
MARQCPCGHGHCKSREDADVMLTVTADSTASQERRYKCYQGSTHARIDEFSPQFPLRSSPVRPVRARPALPAPFHRHCRPIPCGTAAAASSTLRPPHRPPQLASTPPTHHQQPQAARPSPRKPRRPLPLDLPRSTASHRLAFFCPTRAHRKHQPPKQQAARTPAPNRPAAEPRRAPISSSLDQAPLRQLY